MQQVHAEAAADPADLDEQLGELGAPGEQLAELVDHDEQVGSGSSGVPSGAAAPAARRIWYSRTVSTLPASRSIR